MKLTLLTCFLLAGGLTTLPAQQSSGPVDSLGLGCLILPPIDPNKDFLSNFNNSCYAQPLLEQRARHYAGDLNAVYGTVLYHAVPGYQLILAGTFSNSRFFSVTVYDSHSVAVGNLIDTDVLPLTSSMFNPFEVGATYRPNQQYGITLSYGGNLTPNVTPGCSTDGTTVAQNFIDASMIHSGLSWNGYPGLPQGFPVHLTGESTGGSIIVRDYDEISTVNAPVAIVRDLSTGCAVPLKNDHNFISNNVNGGNPWNDKHQLSAHEEFATQIEPTLCYPQDPQNGVLWTRSADYIPGYNTAAAYLGVNFGPSKVGSLISGNQFIQMRFQLPTVPPTPCPNGGCTRTGAEQLRYRSISFVSPLKTLASIKDADMVQDPNGNVTLVIGLGNKPPSYVTASNYYTYFDLSSVSDYKDLSAITMRDILPNASFDCSTFNVPYFTSEYNPNGGFMGNYVPTVNFPTGSQLPTRPVPVMRPDSCALIPTTQPVSCVQ